MEAFFEELSLIEQSSNTEKQWEQAYQSLVEKLHNRAYDELLKHRFEDESEIIHYINGLSHEKSEAT